MSLVNNNWNVHRRVRFDGDLWLCRDRQICETVFHAKRCVIAPRTAQADGIICGDFRDLFFCRGADDATPPA